MPVKIHDANQTYPYSLKDDTEPKTVFFLGALNPRLQSHLSDKLLDNEKHRVLAGSLIRETVRFGLKGWEVLKDLQGNDVVFDEKIHMLSHGTPVGQFKGLSDRALDLLPWKAMQELFNEITESNSLTESDVKN